MFDAVVCKPALAGFFMPDAPMPFTRLPQVRMTALLRDALVRADNDAEALRIRFAKWKSLGAAGEYSEWFFGKDAAYDRPKRRNRNVLRHVHLPPVSSPEKLAEWTRRSIRRSRKTSDRSLVYTEDARFGYLLIHISEDTGAHSLARMSSLESIRLMELFGDVAEAFIMDGIVLI